jgi:hypothetical protein
MIPRLLTMGKRHANSLDGEAGGEFMLDDSYRSTTKVEQDIELKAVSAQALHANLAVDVVCAFSLRLAHNKANVLKGH